MSLPFFLSFFLSFFPKVLRGFLRAPPEALDKLRLFMLPCGTGNGVATSLGVRTVRDAAEALLADAGRARKGQLDLLRIRRLTGINGEGKEGGDGGGNGAEGKGEAGEVLHGALSLTHGAVADCDEVSEGSLRWLPFLTTLLPLWIGLRKASYVAKLTFVLHPTHHALPFALDHVDGAQRDEVEVAGVAGKCVRWTLETDFFSIVVANVPWLATDACMSHEAMSSDGICHLSLIRSRCSRFQIGKVLLGAESGRTADVDTKIMEK